MAATLELTWGAGGALTIAGSGFRPREPVALTIAVRSGGSAVRTGPGMIVQSSQSSSQTTTTIAADADGRIRFQSTIIAPEGTDVTVTAAGSQGSRAEQRHTISAMR
jgi:hypothetical protein